jgi:hypothetical protein
VYNNIKDYLGAAYSESEVNTTCSGLDKMLELICADDTHSGYVRLLK